MSSEAPNPRGDDRFVSSDDSENEAMLLLEAKVRSCEECPLSAGRTHSVPGEGDHNAVVMFVGEGPGFDEDQQGRPFIGRSGKFLTESLNKIGVKRESVYITNVVKCRPPDNRDPLPRELEACAAYLDQQVDLINPRIIVTLGRFSMRRWFPNGSITRIHGQIRNIGRGRVALAMFHPAAALRNPQWRGEFDKDMLKLPALIERARSANEAADRGDGLPAGVPHPGDTDFVGADHSAAVSPDLRDVSTQQMDKPPDADDFSQMSLF